MIFFTKLYISVSQRKGFPGGNSGKESICLGSRLKRCGFSPWVGKIPWRRAWQHTPVFLPGESHGQRSLVGHDLSGHKESDMTEASQHPHKRNEDSPTEIIPHDICKYSTAIQSVSAEAYLITLNRKSHLPFLQLSGHWLPHNLQSLECLIVYKTKLTE